MKKYIIILCLITLSSFSQVGVNTVTPNAMLDIQSTNNGVLIPRVALTSITDAVTVINPAGGPLTTSTLVYNIAPAGIAPNNVVAGFYYWNGSRWVVISSSTDKWSILGNAGTNPPPAFGMPIAATENFIGTKDTQDLILGTNNLEKIRIKGNDFNIGIGVTNPVARLDIFDQGTGTAVKINKISTSGLSTGLEVLANGLIGFGGTKIGGIFRAIDGTDNYAIIVPPDSGNVGIGTSTPSSKLHIENTAAGAVRIVDGTQASGRVLTSNAAGVATWQNPAALSVLGIISNVGANIAYNQNVFIQTGTTLTLPPGRYAVQVTMLLARGSLLPSPNDSSFWVRSTFSDSSAPGPIPSADIVGSNLISGNFPGTNLYAMLAGTVIINNSTTANKTYYYVAGRCLAFNTTETLTGFASTAWAENTIFALRIN